MLEGRGAENSCRSIGNPKTTGLALLGCGLGCAAYSCFLVVALIYPRAMGASTLVFGLKPDHLLVAPLSVLPAVAAACALWLGQELSRNNARVVKQARH
eukprot:CAMPEP_0172637924 /NCGR_PEP_ID=MMETSP1068-20121228/211486_1 /TAXON_ID=35684 /ORGANISM="Pseudopedinella elastica, Strain CCMP716" /LENGTH=98 /DNA_ID=CAMNT_0013450701 /DNA_START=85 /DNA_END=381 /DNA_ORIENTATION=+